MQLPQEERDAVTKPIDELERTDRAFRHFVHDKSTFTTPEDDKDCDHVDPKDRVPIVDCKDFENKPLECYVCQKDCLDGGIGKHAIVCGKCGQSFCGDCDAADDYDD